MSFLIPAAPEGCQWRLTVDTAANLPICGAESRVPVGSTVMPVSDTPKVKTVGCDPAIEACAKAMGGDDPATAYAAAMLWYQGYPDPPHPGV